ncbi:MAG: 5-formyltetrahydrofolate cyclo-ligase [Legionella sp.]
MADRLKIALRTTMKQIRSRLTVPYRLTAAKQVIHQIKSLEQYRNAKRIALYCAINGEVDLAALWNTAPMQGKFCYFPSLNEDKTLSFLPATPATAFKTNHYNIPEPDVSRELALPIEQLDLIIIPLVAFDSECTRLGMGAGYYDRTLEHHKKGLFIGVAYSFQHMHFITPNTWDVPLDAVITPKKIYWRPQLDESSPS